MEATKTYAESQDQEKFDWNKFLDQESFSNLDWNYAEELAQEWVTCACGNQCSIIPRDSIGAPIDEGLADLGVDFSDHIIQRNVELSKETLLKIEKRSAELILELQNLPK